MVKIWEFGSLRAKVHQRRREQSIGMLDLLRVTLRMQTGEQLLIQFQVGFMGPAEGKTFRSAYGDYIVHEVGSESLLLNMDDVALNCTG